MQAQLTRWYVDEIMPVSDIQSILRKQGLDLTIAQIGYALRRFKAVRPRNAKSPKFSAAAQKRIYAKRICKFCKEEYQPTASSCYFCKKCCVGGSASKRIKNYGLNQVEYDSMILEQKNKCAICKKEMTSPHVDHNHMTQQIRGLLCGHCNLRLDVVENVDFMIAAKLYLQHYDMHPLKRFVKKI